VEYLKYFGSMVTNDARCTLEIKSRIAMATQHSTRRRQQSEREFKEETSKVLHLELSFVLC
jgi:hypothetical protein